MSSTLCLDPPEIIKPVVLGATGRLGGMLRDIWGPGGATWQARSARGGHHAVQPFDIETLKALLRGAPAVLCLWGTVPGQAEDMGENVTLARAALDAAAEAGAGRVFLASSAAVYGNARAPLHEGVAAPVSDYGRAKLDMERMATAHPHPSCALRIGNVAGADAILAGWRPGMALDATPARGTPRRSYVGPHGLAKTVRALMRLPNLPPVLNLATPGAVAMGDLLDHAGLDWKPRTPSANVIWNVELDTTRLASLVRFDADDVGAQAIVSDWRAWKDGT
ncbi:MAG: NAD-dependent epimerase/dehydratase family protein [Pseudomonadota bacterium]